MITIPNGWENLELGKILKVETGSKNAEDSSEDGIYPFFTRAETTQKIDAYSYDTEALFIAGEGHFRVKYYKGKFEVHQRTYMLTSKNKENTHLPFLQKAIQPKIFQLINTSVGSTVMSLRKPIIENIEILLPKSKKEQEKIAEILSEVDSAIDKAEAYYEKNRKIKIALMQDLLTHGIDEKGKIRDPKTHQYKASPLGDIPIEWETKELSLVIDFLDHKRQPLKSTDRQMISGIYPYYGASGIIDYVDDYIFDEELILIGEDGANILDRNSRLVFLAKGKYWVNNHAHVLKPKNDMLNYYLCEYLESLNYEHYNSGTAQPKLNKKALSSILIKKPKKTEQQKIAKILSSQDEKIEKAKAKLEKLKSIKTALMQDLLSGTKRVNHLLGEEI